MRGRPKNSIPTAPIRLYLPIPIIKHLESLLPPTTPRKGYSHLFISLLSAYVNGNLLFREKLHTALMDAITEHCPSLSAGERQTLYYEILPSIFARASVCPKCPPK